MAANPTPEAPKKPKMADWAEGDSDYDEEEEFNYNKQPGEEEDPCEDDHVKFGSGYKSRDGQKAHGRTLPVAQPFFAGRRRWAARSSRFRVADV